MNWQTLLFIHYLAPLRNKKNLFGAMQILLAKFFCLWNASVTVAGLRRQQGAVSWAVRRGWPPCSGSSLNQGIGVYVSLPVYVGLQKQHRLNDHLGALCCPEKCVDLDGQMARKSQPNCYTLMSILFLISFFFLHSQVHWQQLYRQFRQQETE